jgi:hypothetical protein
MIEELRRKVAGELFEFSKHATDQSILRNISVAEIREAFAGGAIIEDYPDDKYGSSCLILGFTEAERTLHIQCSHPGRPLIKTITLYEPDPNLWTNFTERKPR